MPMPSLPEMLMGLLAVLCLVVALAGLRLALLHTSWKPALQQKIFITAVVIVALWLVVVSVLAQKGVLAQFDAFPPRALLIVALPIVAALAIAFTKRFKILLRATPLHWLVLFQPFRMVVEIVLWQAFKRGLIPVQMTFEGRNFDVVSGVLALAAGIYMQQRPRHAVVVGWMFNIIGLALLINIMAVSILSMPTPMRYFTEGPANTLVVTFPFVYLPSVLVTLAFSFHVFSMRQLWLYRRAASFKNNINPAEGPAMALAHKH